MATEVVRRKKSRGREREYEDDTPNTRQTSRFWKAVEGEECASRLWTWVDRLRPRLVADCYDDLIHEAIYEGRPIQSIGESRGINHLRSRRSSTARFNITQSMVDTATARLTKRRPMPVISADDAAWSEKRFAKRASRVLRRKMGGSRVERMSPDVIRDMIIRGDGVAKVIRMGGDVSVDRIPIHELVYDPREAFYGMDHIRTLVHHRPMPREVLCEEYPEYEEAIETAATWRRDEQWMMYAYQGESFADHVEVAEAWHLPAGPNANNGQHVIAIRGQVLMREPWTRPRFPIVRCNWSSPTRGFRGRGLVEGLSGIQAKIDDILRDVQEALYWGSTLKVFSPRTSGVNKHHLRARHPVVVEYDGAAPSYVAPNPVSEQALRVLEMLMQKAYEISGISQMSANSKNVLGSNASGKAIDTLDDIQSDRFAHVEAGYRQFRVDLGTLMVDEARALAMEASGETEKRWDEQPDPIEKSELAEWINDIEWKRVELDAGSYHLIIEPINFLPDDRGGRLSYVAEMSKAGLLPDPTMTADLFDEPDIARANRGVLGPKHNIDRILEGLADPGVDMMDLMPDQHMNLALAKLLATGELQEAAANNATEEELERYRAFLAAVKVEETKATASPSLPGMMADSMGAAPNAATLMPGMPPAPTGMPDPGMMPADGMPLS